jgi:hypothetical protein
VCEREREDRCIQSLCGERETTWKIGAFGRIILKCIYMMLDGDIDWFNLAHDGER